ncbi:ATP-binding cassette domain-containing protein [Kineosporia babensis]|uniref:ATP-binding cassette domain-containing protein n=1 Tax=Kineosporia babensis TaxID=499548 RepID=UPI0022AEC0C2|nr:ATP-binding cassette domain-containing protein [Kineosporia babensis]
MIHIRYLAAAFTSGRRCRRRSVQAPDGVHLDVARGEIVSLLGPNGLGKTTALQIITKLAAAPARDGPSLRYRTALKTLGR